MTFSFAKIITRKPSKLKSKILLNYLLLLWFKWFFLFFLNSIFTIHLLSFRMVHGSLLSRKNYQLWHRLCHQTLAQNINVFDCMPSCGCNRNPR